MDLTPGALVTPNVRLLRPLRDGGMGSVWVAEHLTLRTQVAVKFISEELLREDPGMRERFEREAALAAQIKSEHVVHTHDQGLTPDGRPYIVMELLEGNTLTEWIDVAGPLDPHDVATLVGQIGKALSRAHRIGIIHRDIKTDNVFLVDSDDELFVKILDFGIAKHTRLPELDKRTKPGTIIGTPEFMSPEQMLADQAVDYRVDLWALGVVAYYAMTGEVPFQGATLVALCLAVLEAKPPPPSKLNPLVPPAFDAWCARALARDPAERFASAREMADAMQRAAAGSTSSPEALTSRPRPSRPRSSRSGRGLDADSAGRSDRSSARRSAQGRTSSAEAGDSAGGWDEPLSPGEPRAPFSSPPPDAERDASSWTGKDTEPETALPLVRPAEAPGPTLPTPTIAGSASPVRARPPKPRTGRRIAALGAAALAIAVGVGVAQLLESRGWSPGASAPERLPTAPPSEPSLEPSIKTAPRAPDEIVTSSQPAAPDLVAVAEGEFVMGCRRADDARCDRDEVPHRKVRLGDFEIDRLEVDVAKYAACVRAGRCSTDGVTEGELCNWSRDDRLDHPMNCVDWHQARAYCAWVGMRLPSEAEWERAARGKGRRIYPWGDEPPSCKLAVMDDGGDGCGRDSTWPVGSRPAGASPDGALDLAGNVWEWVADRYDPRYYEQAPRHNPLGPESGIERAVRGGSWLSNDVADLRATERHGSPASYRSYNLGFRCARSKPEGAAAAANPSLDRGRSGND